MTVMTAVYVLAQF